MKITVNELKSLTEKSLKKQGFSPSETKVISNILLYAQLRGNNQGVVKLIGSGIPKRSGNKPPKIVKETPVSALYDGRKTHAMLVMDMMTDTAISKAKKSGVGIAGNFNTDESTGALGYYAKKIADQGLIGIAFASAPFQATAPFGSTEARFCTNPMAYGIPTKTSPIILDMSTSAMAYYGLIEAKTANRKVVKGIGFDSKGKETTSPAEIMSGAIRAFGGHKGSGLALVVQILAGALVRADSFDNDSDNAGNLVVAIDPSILTPKQTFVNEVSSIVKRVKSARKEKDTTEIFIPGERGDNFYDKVVKSGKIDVEKNLYKELKKTTR